MNKFNYNNLTPFKWFVLENFPFIEADFDALSEWQLFCKLGKEINKIIDNTNTLGLQVENLTNFVSNYFDNLDVQEEINNKLNDMAESGELADIIAQYLELQGLLCYNTKLDMKNATNLVNGSFAKTYGDLVYNDGKGNFYKIREILNTDVVDDINIIALSNTNLVAELIPTNDNFKCFDTLIDLKNSNNLENGYFAKTLGYYNINDNGNGFYKIRTKTNNDIIDGGLIVEISDTLIAELIYNNTINIKQFGVKGDNETDDTIKFQLAINSVPQGTKIIIPNGDYIITNKIIMPNTSQNKYVILEGQNRDYTKLKFNLLDDTLDCAIQMTGTGTDVLNKCILKHLRIENIKENDTSNTNGINLNYNLQINCLEDISITKFYDNINLGSRNWSFTLKNIRSSHAKRDGIHAQGTINNVHFVGCDLMYNKNANILLQGAMNCSIENTDFSVYENGVYGAFINYCNSINILNCYFESGVDCTEILSGIYVNQTIGFFINSIDFSINASKADYIPVHIKNSNCTKIEAFNFSNTNSERCQYAIYYDSGYEHGLGSAYFKNVITCVFLTVADLHITEGFKIDANTVDTTIETSSTGFLFGRIRNEIYRKTKIHNTAKSGCHLVGNAQTQGNTANRPYVYSIGQVYRDTQINKIIFGKEMPTFNSDGSVASGNTWVDVNNVNV